MSKSEILDILKKYKTDNSHNYGVLEMGVFGSVAREQINEASDVDIFVKMETPNPFFIVHIKEELEKFLNMHVDIVRFRDKMNPFLKNRIESEGIYV
ncbi:MAG: nucleotidyltransferase domain-containing protein [FCB group bacterium]|jgi:predicted nucleotidyltransferase